MKKNNLTLEDVTKGLQSYLTGRDNQDSVISDIDITDHDTTFMVSIFSDGLNLTTGIGGFKMFLDNIGSLDLLKVKYNGEILNLEQRQELYNKYGKGN